MNKEDVLDESYRKALKLDRPNFGVMFDPERAGIMEAIRYKFLEESGQTRPVVAEMYKLNVYGTSLRVWFRNQLACVHSLTFRAGEQSFFKPHKDTPRGLSMFGSLVIVLPTSHHGGSLVLRGKNQEQEWTFDSAALLSSRLKPSVAYIAFYSDVEHEVLPVTSGFRVTITYNLYFGQRPNDPNSAIKSRPPRGVPSPFEKENTKTRFRTALKGLVDDQTFMPYGALIGFGLHHQYPIPFHLAECRPYLKGTDAIIRDVCDELDLRASVRAVYKTRECSSTDEEVLCEYAPRFGDMEELQQSVPEELMSRFEAISINIDSPVDVVWATPLTAINTTTEKCMAYGNEPIMDEVYGSLCLMIDIPRSNGRRRLRDGESYSSSLVDDDDYDDDDDEEADDDGNV